MSKRIVHICISCFYNDNMGYQENILPKKHYQQGNIVEIITTQSGFAENGERKSRTAGRYKNENNIDVVVLPYKRIPNRAARYLHYVSGLYDELVKFQPDVIFCHGLSFLSIFDLEKYCRKNQVELYFDNHSDYFNTPTNKGKYGLINGFFWPLIAHTGEKYCIKAWGTTPARCDYLIHTYKFSEDKVDLLVMGGDDDFIHPENAGVLRKELCERLNVPENTFLICTGGKINASKKIIELMEAVEGIQDNVVLIIFGSLMADIAETFQEVLKKSPKSYFLGWANQEEIYNCLLACELAVFPGTHSVLWEQAVAAGIPAVFKRRSLMEHVDVGGNCLFLDDDSVGGIQAVISKIVNDKNLYNTMKQTAKTTGIEKFSYNNIAKRAIGE